jgi:hypothetical protein
VNVQSGFPAGEFPMPMSAPEPPAFHLLIAKTVCFSFAWCTCIEPQPLAGAPGWSPKS